MTPPPPPMSPFRRTVVVITGKDFDRAEDSDVALAEALTEFVDVVWISPADSADADSVRTDSVGTDSARTVGDNDGVSPTLTRLRTRARTFALFGRRFRPRRADHSIEAALRDLGVDVDGVVLTDPLGRFPRTVAGHRLLYVTRDLVSGASEAGLPRKAVRRALEVNCADADTVAAASETLALRLHVYTKDMGAVRVVPFGCDDANAPVRVPRTPAAAPTGKLDDEAGHTWNGCAVMMLRLMALFSEPRVGAVEYNPRRGNSPDR